MDYMTKGLSVVFEKVKLKIVQLNLLLRGIGSQLCSNHLQMVGGCHWEHQWEC
jgi:hypothetical protein